MPSPTMIPSFCGAVLTAMSNQISFESYSTSQMYRFEVSKNNIVLGTYSTIKNYFDLLKIPGTTYSTTYSIRAKVQIGGVWGKYGVPCTVTTPSLTTPTIPITKIRGTYCATTLTDVNVKIPADVIAVATGYRFQVVSNGVTKVYDSPIYNFKLAQTGIAVTLNTSYTIKVAVIVNGVYGNYGASCTVTTPAAPVVRLKAKSFEVSAYPNPFETAFKLNLETPNIEVVTIAVYDMMGKLVETHQINPTEIANLQIGNNFAAGIYNVIVSQANEMKAIRLIKK